MLTNRSIGPIGVSELGLGCMRLSHTYGHPTGEEFSRILHQALDGGITYLDTGDVHGAAINEDAVRRALAGRTDEVTIGTKFGTYWGEGGRPEQVVASCETSLQRLGVETLDLLYQFRVDQSVPLEETWGAMSGLVEAGKVRYLGICEASAASIRRAHEVHPVVAVQSEYSLWTRDPETEGVLDATTEVGAGFVASSPLGRRMLTGTITSIDDLVENDSRRNNPRFQGENLRLNLGFVERLRSVADELGMSMAQLALAWLLSRPESVVPIFSTVQVTHLAENLGSASLELSSSDRALIEEAAPPGTASGDRYSDMRFVAG